MSAASTTMPVSFRTAGSDGALLSAYGNGATNT